VTTGSALTRPIEPILPRPPSEQQAQFNRSISLRVITGVARKGNSDGYEFNQRAPTFTPNETNAKFVTSLGAVTYGIPVVSPFVTYSGDHPYELAINSALGTLAAYGMVPIDSGRGAPDFRFYSDFATVDEELTTEAAREADRALEQLSAELGHAVSDRLHELIALARENESPETLPSPQSFRSLVDFLVRNREIRKPGLALDDEGILWAEWRRGPDCFAALRFLADGNIRWTIVTPAPMRKSGRVTWHGDGGADDVRSAIDARRALAWIVRRAGA
jgi:hypothetical protein